MKSVKPLRKEEGLLTTLFVFLFLCLISAIKTIHMPRSEDLIQSGTKVT